MSGFAVIGIAIMAALFFGGGYPTFDTAYALVWGDELLDGGSPDYEVALAPTPHPLATTVAGLASLLGTGAFDALAAVVFLAMGALVWATYRVGRDCFSWRVGLLAAVVVAGSPAIVARTGGSFFDVVAVTMAVLAVAVEARRPRAGIPVLVLLAIAGLQRPEMWPLAWAYALYVLPGLDRAGRIRVAALALAAPLLWTVADGVVTGDPLYSFVTTREAGSLPAHGPVIETPSVSERSYEGLRSILRLPVLIAGFAGVAVALLAFGARARLPAVSLALGLSASMGLGYLGLVLTDRYLFLPAVMLAVLFAAGTLGWGERTARPLTPALRTVWTAGGIAVLMGFAIMNVAKADQLLDIGEDARRESRAVADLRQLAEAPESRAALVGCPHVYVARVEVVPVLAYLLGSSPRGILPGRPTPRAEGAYLVADESLAADSVFELQLSPALRPPVGSREVAGNESWTVHTFRCGAGPR